MELPERELTESPRRFLPALLAMPLGAWAGSFLGSVMVGSTLLRAFQMANLVAVFGAGAALILGLSAHALLRGFGFQHWLAYGASGMLAGSGFILALAAWDGGGAMQYLPLAVVAGGPPGLGAALAFWAVLRPDRGRE